MNKHKTRLLAFIGFLLCGFGECRNSDVMSLVASGYCMVSPPTNLVTPGAIVMMSKDDQGRALLNITCGPRSSLGPMYSPRVSETLTNSFRMTKTQKFEMEAEAIERFKARTKVEDVDHVSVSMNNAKIISIGEDEIFERISDRTEACWNAIQARQDAGYEPTFITSAYIADIEYTVSFKRDRELTKRVREERMGRIAANLGGGHTEFTEHTMRATNLVLAVKSDSYAMTIRPNCRRPNPTPNTVGRSFQEIMADVDPVPDAPYTPPAGGWVSPIIGSQ